MIKVAGFARPSGITFIGPKYQVTTRDTPKGIFIQHRTNPKAMHRPNFIGKLPLVRGAYVFVSMIVSMIVSNNIAIKIFLILWLGMGFILGLPSRTKETIETTNKALITINLFDIALLLFMATAIILFKSLWQYHAAEHMSINTYESGQTLSIKNIRQSSRISPRCGSNIVVIYTLIQFIIISLLHIYIFPYLGALIGFAIAYEIYLWRVKPLLWVGKLFQKYLVTQKPEDYHLLIGSIGLEALISLEENGKLPNEYTSITESMPS